VDLTERYFPFYRYNLTHNPFGTLSEEERRRVTVLPPEIETALAGGFQHLLVLGRPGRGKSTALHYVADHLRARGERVAYERMPRWTWDYTTDTAPLDAFALDEMQRLAPWASLRLLGAARHGLRLVIGSHWDHRPAFRAHGLEVTVVRLNRGASRERLARVLIRRLDAFRHDANAPAALSFAPGAVDWLWETYGSDLRNMSFFLFDVFAALPPAGALTADDLRDFWEAHPRSRRQT